MKKAPFLFKSIILIALLLSSLTSVIAQSEGGLYRFYENDSVDYFGNMGYRNSAGDTIVPLGKYQVCFTHQFKHFAVVRTHESRLIAIDTNDNELFEVYWFDGMPDNEFSQDYGEGELFRIKINGLIGFANFKGEIVIEPQFECTSYFIGGICWVAKKCTLVPDGEYKIMESDEAYYIDTKGNFVRKAD